MRQDKFTKKALRKMKQAAARTAEKEARGMIKPYPKWMNVRLYVWLMGFFIRIEEVEHTK